jgi:hypothetical protein
VADDSGKHGDHARYQTANVKNLADFSNGGAAWLVREKNSIHGRIMANVPQAGLPYTVWFVVVNKPSACADPLCFDPSDFGNPATKTSIFSASGAIAADNGVMGGVINVDVRVEAGKLPNDLFVLQGSRRGLRPNRGYKAMVWLVIDQHPSLTSADSWIADLTTTHQPGMGPNITTSLALFVSCVDAHCPESAL